MNHKIVFMLFAVSFLFPIHFVHAEEEPTEIVIEFLNGDVVDLDAGTQMIRADITIYNYNPQDGFHYMEVTRLSDGTVIKHGDILPSYIEDNVYGVQILHYLDPSVTDASVLGDYELRIHSDFGAAQAIAPFSIIKSSQTPIASQNSEVLEATSEEDSEQDLELEEIIESESRIPAWIRDIFVWFAEGQIGEDDLLSAIKFLVESDIIVLDN
ncbi:MAG: hypothetical protein ACE5RJ_00140 [Nitrosopumilaceae archaeon]